MSLPIHRPAPKVPQAARVERTTRQAIAQPPAPVLDGCRLALQKIGFPGAPSLGIASSIRGEGRSTVAVASALVLADYGVRTVLMELDFQNPSLASQMGIPSHPGLGEFLQGSASWHEVLYPVSDEFFVLPAGTLSLSHPRALLEVSKRDLLGVLRGRGCSIVADLPPLLGTGIGAQAASLFPDILLVVRAGMVSSATVKEAVSSLPTPPRVLLNGVSSSVPDWARRLAGL